MKTQSSTQLGMVGLGRMGANMARRLIKAGHQCIVFDRIPKAVEDLAKEGAVGAIPNQFQTKTNAPHPVP